MVYGAHTNYIVTHIFHKIMYDGVLKGFGSSLYSKREVFNFSEVSLLGSDPNHLYWKILLLIKIKILTSHLKVSFMYKV
jgi:hypothetical protein